MADKYLLETGTDKLLLENAGFLLLEGAADPDDEVASAVAELTTMQDSHYASNGIYWQGRPTYASPANPPETQNWNDKGLACTSHTVTYRCDCYAGPSGKGWMLIAWKIVAGVTYEKHVNYGPETWRDTGWIAL